MPVAPTRERPADDIPAPLLPTGHSSGGGSVPVPDPTALTTDQLRREIWALRELLEARSLSDSGAVGALRDVVNTRLAGMDKAIQLIQANADKNPSDVDKAVENLQKVHEERFRSVLEQIAIQFDGIKTQFVERDKRTEQLSIADKTAIAAALQAQKEAAGAQNDSNTTANSKMENNFAKLIEQTQQLLTAVAKGTDEKITDLKSRLDRGEGKTSVTDPATTEALHSLSAAVAKMGTVQDKGAGKEQGIGMIGGLILGGFAFVSLLIGAGSLITLIVRSVR